MAATEKLIEVSVEVIKEVARKRSYIIYGIASWILCSGFWLIAIFLFSPYFFKQTALWLTIHISLCIGISWMILLTIITVATIGSSESDEQSLDNKEKLSQIFFSAGFVSVILLPTFIFINYFLLKQSLKGGLLYRLGLAKSLNGASFLNFTTVVFGVTYISLLIIVFRKIRNEVKVDEAKRISSKK